MTERRALIALVAAALLLVRARRRVRTLARAAAFVLALAYRTR